MSDLNTMEKSFMNEQKPTFSAEDIKMAERERMSQVFASELVKGKEETAQMLLAKTDMSASDILAVLGTIPTAQKSTDFEKAMAGVPNPNISPSVEEQEETPDMVAARKSEDRDKLLDELLEKIGELLSSDINLTGLTDFVYPKPPEIIEEYIEGAPLIKAAVIPVVLQYSTTNALK